MNTGIWHIHQGNDSAGVREERREGSTTDRGHRTTTFVE